MLKIKTQSCNRLLKEISSYVTETEQNQRKVDEMKAANADEYDIKQQVSIQSWLLLSCADRPLRARNAYWQTRK